MDIEPLQAHISQQHATCDPALNLSRKKTHRPSVLFYLFAFQGIWLSLQWSKANAYSGSEVKNDW